MRETATALLTVMLAAATGSFAEAPSPPPYFAIRDARVVTVSGQILPQATVLIADGVIEAVAEGAQIPPDAWVVEGAGLTVYPGLIDALTTVGQAPAVEESAPSGGGSPGARPSTPVRGPEDRPGTSPWESAAHGLEVEPKQLEKWRQAGFTSVVTTREGGFFPGQAALINLGDSEPEQMVVAAPVAQRVNLRSGRGFGAYPGSLMGILGYVKQVLSDADHYAVVRELYDQDPKGLQRPAYDRTLEPLQQAVVEGLPFLLPADRGRHIDRALELGGEYELRTVLYGVQGGYERAVELARSGVAVLVDLDWPEEDKNRDPDADVAFAELRHRRLAPTTPKALSDAGVPFAFASGGLSSPKEALEKLRQAVEAGLPEARAMRALTLGPAEIFGVDDRLGSVEVGKIANLVVATELPWVEGAEVRAVFVDGRRYQERESKVEYDPPAGDVSGTWTLAIQTPRGEQEVTAELEMSEAGEVSGEVRSSRGTTQIDEGRLSGDQLSLTLNFSMGSRTAEATYSGTVEGESVEGTFRVGGMSGEFSGVRSAAEGAETSAEARVAEAGGGAEVEAAIEAAMELFQGPIRSYPILAITNATVHTATAGVLEGATVVVRDGKITAVGQDVSVPRRAEIIDATGQHLIPGIIDAHSHIAIEGGVNEGSLAVTAMVGIEDVIDPDDISIYRALAGGVTSANLLHGSANPIGGRNAVIKLRWGSDAGAMRFEGAPPGIKFALGENPKRSRVPPRSGIPQRYPATRMGVMDVIRQAFTEAKEYRRSWQLYEAAKAAGENALPPRVDFKLKTLVEILDGERLVHAHCYRADEILQLLRLAEELGFRIATLQHVLEGYKVADEIAAHGAGASTFSDWWAYKVEAYDAIPYNAALMTERGVAVSINSDSGEEMRHLNQEAGKTRKWGGLSAQEALKLVTYNPAVQLGIADRVGSIEVGKDADLVLYDRDPLSVYAVVQKTFVDGKLYFDREVDRQRQARLDAVKDLLLPGRQEDDKSTETPTQMPSTATGAPATGAPAGEGTPRNLNRSDLREDAR